MVVENWTYTCKQCRTTARHIPHDDGTLQVSNSYNFRIDTCFKPAPNDGSRSVAASINLALCHGPFISVFFACPCATLQLNVSGLQALPPSCHLIRATVFGIYFNLHHQNRFTDFKVLTSQQLKCNECTMQIDTRRVV